MSTMKDLRESVGLRQADVAGCVGVGARMYRRWENGDSEIPTGRLIPLARVFDVTLEDLLEAWAEVGCLGAEDYDAF